MAEKKHLLLTISAAFDGTLATWWSDPESGNANRVLKYHPGMSIEEIAKLYEADGYRYEIRNENPDYPQHKLILASATEGDFLAEKAKISKGFGYQSAARMGKRFAQYVIETRFENPEAYAACLLMANHQMDGAEIGELDKGLFWEAVNEYANSLGGFPIRDGFVDGFAEELLSKRD